MVSDSVALAGFALSNVQFGLGTSLDPIFAVSSFDGLMGFADSVSCGIYTSNLSVTEARSISLTTRKTFPPPSNFSSRKASLPMRYLVFEWSGLQILRIIAS